MNVNQHKILNFIYYKPKQHHLRLDYLKKPLVFKLYSINLNFKCNIVNQ
jgi:hypothetical protein